MSLTLRSFLAGAMLVISPTIASDNPVVKRARFDAEAVIIKGTWSCTPEQILIIDQAVVDAHEFANEALTALKNPNVLSSPAYDNWFGSDAGGGPSVAILRDRHYQVVIDSLKPPSVETAFRFKPEPFFPPNTVTENSLVFGCSGATGPCADGAMVAGVNSATESQPAVFGTTMLLLCETFFDATRASNKKMIENWRAESSVGEMSRGFALVHEVQHMLLATGDGERADDLNNPFFGIVDDRSEDCYSANCCFRLSAAEKAKNAQNYAIFALDVTAFPITEEQPNACQAPARPSTLAKVRRQMTFSNSTMSSGASSSSASATRTPIPPVLFSSTSQPPASRVSSARPSSSAEVVEVSGAVAVIIPAGAVAFGGPGGGLANFGGVIIPVPEGQTVSDPSKDPKPSGEAPSTTPGQPSTTSSAPATSSSCAPPAQKSYGPAVEKVCEDWSGMNQTAFLGLMDAVPVVDWEGASVVSATPTPDKVQPSPTSSTRALTTASTSALSTAVPVPPPKPRWSEKPTGFTKTFEQDGVASAFYYASSDSASENVTDNIEQWCLAKCTGEHSQCILKK
ncbi:Subtilase [Colletotrichum higginsianum IMI 349063]|uniref:Subtilase n=2 Tax=Colletotrichum higginsianum (strain IMI 349063) TaxID=759273 RepID=A0A1B7YN32_COLHI|nr:Subtilase [Colletotrichum higginsianum IMI 349063]OBR13429.1 Subtilase [Colletotrichum higginsianum IMI 349063]